MASGIINSYINSNQNEVMDTEKPFTFIEYITNTTSDNTTESFKEYKKYLSKWAETKNSNGENINSRELIQKEIIELFKVITLSYATFEEQAFLAGLNWDISTYNEQDKNALYSALPIFVSRLKDIASFYRKKRSEATFIVEKNRIKGTSLSIEKIIYDKIVDYLFNNSPEKLSSVQNYLNISIDNYVDIYSDYFDIERGSVDTVNYNDIEPELYFELKNILADMLFDKNVYLREIPLIAQLAIDFSQDCIGDKLTLKNELLAKSKLSQITDDEKIALKKKLYSKYLGVDFYYLLKDSDGNILSDIFIKADEPTNNLLNQQTVDTPTNSGRQLKLLKDIGLFFKPCTSSLLRVNTYNYEYIIDEALVKTNKLYIFPDPKVYGNVSFNSQKDYPFIIEYSFDEYIKNYSLGWAANDPSVSNLQQAIYSYYSKEEDINKINKNNKVSLNFDELYNKGYIFSLKQDLYGNKFALYKEQKGKFARDYDITKIIPDIHDDFKYLEIDGGTLKNDKWTSTDNADMNYWTLAGRHAYNYFIEGGISYMSGENLTPRRAFFENNIPVGNGSFIWDIRNYKINDGSAIIDGATFDTIYALYDVYNGNGSDFISLAKNEKFESTLITADPEKENYKEASEKTYYDVAEKIGKVYINIPGSNTVEEIENIFTWWFENKNPNREKYIYFINNLVDIDIIENVLILKAQDNLSGKKSILFEPLNFDIITNKFIKDDKDPVFFYTPAGRIVSEELNSFNTKTFEEVNEDYYSGNNNIYNKGSNLFYIENSHKCYIAIMNMKLIQTGQYKTPTYYPDLYEINLKDLNVKKYSFDFDDMTVSEQCIESFSVPETLFANNTIVIQKVGEVTLSFSTLTNMFMLVYTVYDQNLSPYIFKQHFSISSDNNLNKGIKGTIITENIESTLYGPGMTKGSDVLLPDYKDELEIYFVNNKILR